MGRVNHGVRKALWFKRNNRYRRRKRREWKRGGHYHYLPIQGGPVVTVHRQKWLTVLPAFVSPGLHPWIKFPSHFRPSPFVIGWTFHLTHDGDHKTPHIHAVPPLLFPGPHGVKHPQGPLIGYFNRGTEPARHKPGRGGAFRRGCWGAFIHQKLNAGLWPAWDPKHRTPVDPDT